MHGKVIIPSLFKAQNFEGISYRETPFSTEGESSPLSEILTGNLTLSCAYWLKTDSGPLTSLQCTVILNILYQ